MDQLATETKLRVLIIEDEAKIAGFLQRGFREEAWEAEIARNGESGLTLAMIESFDLVVLDVMLPAMDGFSVLSKLRAAGKKFPIIMLTALGTVPDRIRGLNLGADDYLAKPFSFDELIARARAVMRRSIGVEDVLRVGDLSLDRKTLVVERCGRLIELSNREYALLEYLMSRPGMVSTRAMIAEHVWGIDFDTFTNTIDVYIKYLRDKVEQVGCPRLLKTIRGRGYTISSEEIE